MDRSEEEATYKENWKVKDNLIIAVNTLNRKIILDNHRSVKSSDLYRLSNLYEMACKIKTKYKISILEASEIIKVNAKNMFTNLQI